MSKSAFSQRRQPNRTARPPSLCLATSPRSAYWMRGRRSAFPLTFERLEDRCCLSASGDLSLNAAPLPAITEQQALSLAFNDITESTDGFVITNRRHTASLTSAGFSMEPVNGGPHWHWQLSYVGSPTATLSSVQLEQVEPESNGQTLVRYDRGTVVEQYVTQLDSIEQQFVIAEPLELGDQDLVVAGTIQSPGAFETTGNGWLWRTDSGVISLGDVTVLDANGRELEASMTVSATETRIVVDAAALRDAVYPLLIDPEIGTNDFRISDMGPSAPDFDAREPAVAYNSTDNQYLVVWSGDDFTNNEMEIFGQRINAATGAPVGADDFRISNVGVDGNTAIGAVEPAVAYNSTNNQYLVVWSGDNVDGDFEISGQRLTASGSEIGLDFGISSMGTPGSSLFDAGNPDVAYNTADNEYLVVWDADDNTAPLVDNEFEIFGQRLSAATGNSVGVDDFRISDMGPNGDFAYSALNPAVAYNSTGNDYVVVWYGDDNIAPLVEGENEIFRQRLSAAGVELGANDFRVSDMGSDGSADFAALDPDVAYNSTNNEYLVVWKGDDVTNGEFEIFGQRLNGTAANLGTNDFRISDLGPDPNALFDADHPSVTYSAAVNEYLVVWNGDDDTAPLVDNEFEIFGQRLNGATAAAVGSNDFRISDIGPNGNTSLNAFAPVVAFNSTNNEYQVVWEADFRDNEFEIFTQRLAAATGLEVGTNDRRISDVGSEGNFAARESAIAFNSISNEYLVVWAGENTADNEFEIFGQRINATTGAEVGTNDFRISDMGPDGNTSFSVSTPAVAFNSTINQYLVIWQGEDDIAPLVVNEREIFGQRLSAAGTALGANDFRISDAGPNGNINFDVADPAVAYNSTNNQYLVVWSADDNTAPLVDNEYEIFGQRISAAGAAVGANDFRISDMGPNGNNAFDALFPAVAYNSSNNNYLVVWSGDDNIAPLVDNELEIFGQLINAATGAEFGDNDFRISDMGPDGNVAYDALAPAVAFNSTNNNYLVVWTGDDNTAPLVDNEFEIFGQILSGATGSWSAPNDSRISDMGTNGNPLFVATHPAVTYNNTLNEFLAVWSGVDQTPGELEIFGQRLSGLASSLGQNDFRISDMGPDGDTNTDAGNPAVAANSTNQFLVVWDGRETGGVFGNGETEIFGQRFEVAEFGAAVNSLSTLQAGRDDNVAISIAPLTGVLISPANVRIGDRAILDGHVQALPGFLNEWFSAQPISRRAAQLGSIGEVQPFTNKILNSKQVDLLIGIEDPGWFGRASLDSLFVVLTNDELN